MSSGIASYSATATNFGRGATDGYYLNDPAGNVVVNNIQVNQAVTVDGGVTIAGGATVDGTLTVGGLTTLGDGANVTGVLTATSVQVAGDISLNGNVNAGQHVHAGTDMFSGQFMQAVEGFVSGTIGVGAPALLPLGASGGPTQAAAAALVLPKGLYVADSNKYGSTLAGTVSIPEQQPTNLTPVLVAAANASAGSFSVQVAATGVPVALVYVTTTALQPGSVVLCSVGTPDYTEDADPLVKITTNRQPFQTGGAPPSTPYFSIFCTASANGKYVKVSWLCV